MGSWDRGGRVSGSERALLRLSRQHGRLTGSEQGYGGHGDGFCQGSGGVGLVDSGVALPHLPLWRRDLLPGHSGQHRATRGGGALFHGRGVWNEGGHTYSGGFLYGKVNGKAVWSWPGEGSHMEGSFKRGYAHGPGVLYFRDGSRFEGSFKKGYPNGQGAVKLSNDSVLWEGTFTNGAPDEQVGEGLQTLFTHFHTYPLRMKRSLKWR